MKTYVCPSGRTWGPTLSPPPKVVQLERGLVREPRNALNAPRASSAKQTRLRRALAVQRATTNAARAPPHATRAQAANILDPQVLSLAMTVRYTQTPACTHQHAHMRTHVRRHARTRARTPLTLARTLRRENWLLPLARIPAVPVTLLRQVTRALATARSASAIFTSTQQNVSVRSAPATKPSVMARFFPFPNLGFGSIAAMSRLPGP